MQLTGRWAAFLAAALTIAASGLALPALAQAGQGGAAAPPAVQAQAPAALTAEAKKKVLDALQAAIERTAFVPNVDFAKWPEKLESEREAIDAAQTESQLVQAVNRAMQRFGFSHITLFPPDFGQQRLTQRRAGIGIRIQVEAEGIRVVDVFPDSPATKAGIQIGDLIFESDGKPVKQVGDLAGEKGQTSSLKLKRGTEVLEKSVTRDEYRTVIPESLSWWKDNKAAVVKIPTFDQGYDRENVDKIMVEAKNAPMIVLDLRGNGGGLVLNLQHLMRHFLDRENQPMGTFIGRVAVREFEKETGSKATDLAKVAEFTKAKVRPLMTDSPVYKGKVVVLVNGATGSASEMAAAALREHRGAQVIGSKTAGAVLASMMMPLRDSGGFWVQLPVTDYVTIKGLRIEGNGVVPDQEAATPRFGEADDALSKALALLQLDPK